MWPRSTLKRLELILIGAGFLYVFGLCVLRILPESDIYVVPFLREAVYEQLEVLVCYGFGIVGLGLHGPRFVAALIWGLQEGRVEAISAGDPGTISYRYCYQGQTFSGKITETTSKRPGDPILLSVYAPFPSEHFTDTATVYILGVAFVVFGFGAPSLVG